MALIELSSGEPRSLCQIVERARDAKQTKNLLYIRAITRA